MRIPGFCNVRVLGLDWNCRVNVLEAILKLAVERERESLHCPATWSEPN